MATEVKEEQFAWDRMGLGNDALAFLRNLGAAATSSTTKF
jgi:hypothetical protein